MKAVFIFFIALAPVGIWSFKSKTSFQNIDKPAYYNILKKGSIKEINSEISLIETSSLTDKDAFKGALLMKKAGLADIPKQKLDYFKSGRIKLETAISSDSANVEYRFLRLIIQEHAPKAVKYNGQVNEDAAFIKKNYNQLSPEVKAVLVDYSKTSKYLNPQDFQS